MNYHVFTKNCHRLTSKPYFFFQDRIIWYYSYLKEGYQLITFLDEALRVKEEKDYLSRIETHPEKNSKQKFDEKIHTFGTLTMVYKMEKQEVVNENKPKKQKRNSKQEKEIPFQQIVYQSYKQRNEIEPKLNPQSYHYV